MTCLRGPSGNTFLRGWKRNRPAAKCVRLLWLEPARKKQRASLLLDHDPLIGPGHVLDRTGQDQVPQMALKRGKVQGAQLAPHACEGAAKIGRVIDEIGHDTSRRRTIEPALCLGPPAPALAQNGFLGLGRRAIGWIGFGERQLERPLGIALEPRVPDEFTRSTDRAESLVVKIIRQPVCARATAPDQAPAALLGRRDRESPDRTDCRGNRPDDRDDRAFPGARASRPGC